MKLFLSQCITLVCLSAFSGSLSARDVLVVDAANGAGADFTDIQAAVDAALSGDVLLVRSGQYSPFTITAKALTIEAEAGTSPSAVAPTFFSAPTLQIDSLGAGQDVFIRGIDFDGPDFRFTYYPVADLNSNTGSIYIEDCDLGVGNAIPVTAGMNVNSCNAVTLVRCTIVGQSATTTGTAGINATSSGLALFDCSVVGPRGLDNRFFPPTKGGEGVSLDGSSLFASGCSITGGAGGDAVSLPVDGADGGDGLRLDGTPQTTRIIDTVLGGGPGGLGVLNMQDGDVGLPSVVATGTLVELEGNARSLVIGSPLRAGSEDIVETFTGSEGDLVIFAYSSTGQIPPTYLSILNGSLVAAPPLVLVLKGKIDGTGILVSSVPTGPLDSGLESLLITTQSAFVAQNGQGIFLSSPSTILLLGQGF